MDMDDTYGSEPSAGADAPIPLRDVVEAFLEQAGDGVFVTDHEDRIALINTPAELLFGYDRRELLGRHVQILIPGGLPRPSLEGQGGPGGRRWREAELNLLGRHKDGSDMPVHVSVTYPGEAGQFAATVFLRKAAPEEAVAPPGGLGPPGVGAEMPPIPTLNPEPRPVDPAPEPALAPGPGLHDRLTGLPGEVLFMDRLSVALAGSARKSSQVAVLLLDIDYFKSINDSYGHDAGDDVLREFAIRMKKSIRGIDLACRYGGEEFVVVMPETDMAVATVVAERLRRRIASEPFPIQEGAGKVEVTISIGIAALRRGESAAAVLKRADQALYRAKRDGRNRVVPDAA